MGIARQGKPPSNIAGSQHLTFLTWLIHDLLHLSVLLALFSVGCKPPDVTDARSEPPGMAPAITDPMITALAWNVESGGNDPTVIAGQL